jgi:hypothetical protein
MRYSLVQRIQGFGQELNRRKASVVTSRSPYELELRSLARDGRRHLAQCTAATHLLQRTEAGDCPETSHIRLHLRLDLGRNIQCSSQLTLD